MWYAADTTEIRLAITLVEVIFWLVVDRDYCQSGLKLSTSSPEKPCGSFCIFFYVFLIVFMPWNVVK